MPQFASISVGAGKMTDGKVDVEAATVEEATQNVVVAKFIEIYALLSVVAAEPARI